MRQAPARAFAPVLLASLFATAALGQDASLAVRQERSEVRERMALQKAAMALLGDRRVEALELLEIVERLARASAERAGRLEAEVAALQARIHRSEEEEAQAAATLKTHLGRLGPRLRVMHRMSRRSALDALVAAEDFSQLVWRWRALSRLLDQDLLLLADVRLVAAHHRSSARRLELLEQALGSRVEALRAEARRADARRADLRDLLALLTAESSRGGRLLEELDRAERELSRAVLELEAAPPRHGFGALRGRLPLPVTGRIEVGYGRVVNPRFNTVTLQNGLDIRAPPGSAVAAVAPGQVVYAGWLRGYGNLVILDHGEGYHTLMAHLRDQLPEVGLRVSAGERVGRVGDTASLKGAYLYFELRHQGRPLDPSPWLSRR